MDYFLTDLEITPVIPYDPSFPRDTVPSYMTPSVLFGAFLQENGCYPEPSSATFKLLDFGRGKWDKAPHPEHCLVLGSPADYM